MSGREILLNLQLFTDPVYQCHGGPYPQMYRAQFLVLHENSVCGSLQVDGCSKKAETIFEVKNPGSCSRKNDRQLS